MSSQPEILGKELVLGLLDHLGSVAGRSDLVVVGSHADWLAKLAERWAHKETGQSSCFRLSPLGIDCEGTTVVAAYRCWSRRVWLTSSTDVFRRRTSGGIAILWELTFVIRLGQGQAVEFVSEKRAESLGSRDCWSRFAVLRWARSLRGPCRSGRCRST